MKKQENKKFGFEKFEMAKLSILKQVNGGGEKIKKRNGDDDPGTVTDLLSILSGDKCIQEAKGR